MRHSIVPKPTRLSAWLAIGAMLASLVAIPGPAESREANRTLKLYFGHTKERGEFTFKRNGRYDKKELARINRFLRDWRRNEPANMDPKLLDLIWAVYKDAGGRDYIHVVSAYRSLATNNKLRSRSKGVAEKSQHTAGKAMDFYIPGVPLAKLRASAMKFQSGGVGYYPTSGSPFVHVDTGSVRYWPRMPRKQLLAMFPDGETLYLPSDGKPLPGYERALAQKKSSGGTALAYLDTGTDGAERVGSPGGWLKRVFSGGADEAEDNEATGTAAAPAEPPPPAAQPTAPPAAPAFEPAFGEPQILLAEEASPEPRLPKARPAAGSETLLAAVAPRTPEAALAEYEVEALTSLAYAPLPKTRPDSELLAATLDGASDPASLDVQAEDAIAALAARSEAVAVAEAGASPVHVAALPEPGASGNAAGDQAAIDAFAAIDEATSAVADASGGPPAPRPRPLALAFAGAGLPRADAAVPPAPAAIPSTPPAPQAAVAPAVQQSAPTEAIISASLDTAAAPVEAEAAGQAGKPPAARKGDFAGFAMPQPAAMPELFTAPATAASVGIPDARLPAHRFQPAQQPAPAPVAEESFFSRLLAGLTG